MLATGLLAVVGALWLSRPSPFSLYVSLYVFLLFICGRAFIPLQQLGIFSLSRWEGAGNGAFVVCGFSPSMVKRSSQLELTASRSSGLPVAPSVSGLLRQFADARSAVFLRQTNHRSVVDGGSLRAEGSLC